MNFFLRNDRMTAFFSFFATILMTWLAFQPAAIGAPRSITIKNDTLGEVTVLAPAEEPSIFAVLLSDTDGLTPARREDAEALVARGAAVALVDLKALITKLAESADEDCHYAFGDFEDIARTAERELNMSNWLWPVILGIGEGGTLAYLALAQAPENTAAGAVSVGFDSDFASKLPMCAGAPETGSKDGVHTYAPMKKIPGRWVWIADNPPPVSLAPFASASPGSQIEIIPGDYGTRFKAAVDALIKVARQPATGLDDLPLVELPAKSPAIAFAVFISGDGGWRDIDKEIGEALTAKGVAVVGIDSLRYFWSKKDPKKIAADIQRIISHYQKAWNLRRTALLGYSFGADVIPFIWAKLPPQTQDDIKIIGLIGLEPTADFEISVAGWLGMSSGVDVPVQPYLKSLPDAKLLCFYGVDEKRDNETACLDPEIDENARVERPGGHHFDGNYQAVAQIILGRMRLTAGF